MITGRGGGWGGGWGGVVEERKGLGGDRDQEEMWAATTAPSS